MPMIIFYGIILIVETFAITLGSRLFAHGGNVSVYFFLGCSLFGVVVYFLAIRRILTLSIKDSLMPWVLHSVFWVSLICRVVLSFSEPIKEVDYNRYLWDGYAVKSGENPYSLAPEERYVNSPEESAYRSQEARSVYEAIQYASIRTIYPPAAQFTFALSQWISPWKLWGWRCVVLLFELGILWMLFLLLRHFKKRAEWLLIYGWSPLVLKEFSNSLHVDVVAVFFMLAAIYALLKSRWVLAYATLALCVLTKWYALCLLPFFLVWTLMHARVKVVLGGLVFGAVFLLCYMPFISAGSLLFEGLSIFAGFFKVNASLFSLIEYGVGFLPLSVYQQVFAGRVVVAALLMVIGLLCALKLWRDRSEKVLISSCLILLAALFFLSPTGNPWYFTWVMALVVLVPSRALILFSGLVFLYYFDFVFAESESAKLNMIRWFEYLPFYAALGWELWTKKRFRL